MGVGVGERVTAQWHSSLGWGRRVLTCLYCFQLYWSLCICMCLVDASKYLQPARGTSPSIRLYRNGTQPCWQCGAERCCNRT